MRALLGLLGHQHGGAYGISAGPVSSLLDVPDDRGLPIRASHQSFLDFLTNRRDCEDERFFVYPLILHENAMFSWPDEGAFEEDDLQAVFKIGPVGGC